MFTPTHSVRSGKSAKSSKRSSTTERVRSAATSTCEILEDRRLFSVLTISDTAGSDLMKLSQSGSQLTVNLNGHSTVYDTTGVTEIDVNCTSGNDRVLTDSSVSEDEKITAGWGNDALTGGSGNVTILGGPGNDVLFAGNGNDVLTAGAGNTTMYGGTGHDTITGTSGWGKDVIYANQSFLSFHPLNMALLRRFTRPNYTRDLSHVSNVTGFVNPLSIKPIINPVLNPITLGSARGSAPSSPVVSHLTSAQSMVPVINPVVGPISPITYHWPLLNFQTDVINCGSGPTTVYGGGGFETINGGSGDDVMYGGDGFCQIYCGTGNDTATGGSGHNQIWGGSGNDLITGGPNTTNILHAGSGNDTILGGAGNSSNTIYGGPGHNKLYARGTGHSWVYGGTGDEQLFGGQGYGYLAAGSGQDTIVSLSSYDRDTVVGGSGLDQFWITSSVDLENANFIEALAGTIHRVDSFANGASLDLFGQGITEPDASRDLGNGHTYYPGWANFSDHPLFSSSGPAEDDIIQGGAGDCYFVAALSGTAKADPLRIRDTVVDLGDGTYAVQFWNNGTPKFYRVDGNLPTGDGSTPYYANFGAEGSIWVPIIEKAFTYFRKGQDSYQSIWNGGDDEFHALNGQLFENVYGSSSLDTLLKIKNAMDNGKQVIAGTPGSEPNNCPIVGDHMYTVDHVDTQTINILGLNLTIPVDIVVRNPWGVDGGTPQDNTPRDGYITLTPDQFYSFFNYAEAALV